MVWRNNMNKIGFAIKVVDSGSREPIIVCNGGNWVNKVSDIREYLKLFIGLQGTKNILTFMSFDEGGCYITMVRAIPSRDGDFISGWLYIPSNLKISNEEMMNVYEKVKDILFQTNIEHIKPQIQEFFAKPYCSKKYFANYMPSKGSKFGKRHLSYVRYNMAEIIGEDRYQSYYSKYKAIFILDKEYNVKIKKESDPLYFEDLTNKDIKKSAILIPPTNEELNKLGNGTKLLFDDGNVFIKPICTFIGDKINFILKREGFKSLSIKNVGIESEEQNLNLSSVNIIWKKFIDSTMFNCYDEDNVKIDIFKEGLRIYVNGNDITNSGSYFTETCCINADINIDSKKYEPFHENRNLLKKDERRIFLERKTNASKYNFVLENGHIAEITIKSKYIEISDNKSPLIGYVNNNKTLSIDTWYIFKQRIYGFIACIVFALIIIIAVAVNVFFDTYELRCKGKILFGILPKIVVVEKFENIDTGYSDNNSVNANHNKDEYSDSLAINYMKKNVWSKDSLDNYPLTNGLYDKIKRYKFDELEDKLEKVIIIEDCPLLDSIKLYSISMNTLQLSIKGSYPDSGGKINIDEWLKSIREDVKNKNKQGNSNLNGGYHQ